MGKAKPFDIPKREVWEAFKKVKANQGAAGVDGQSVADFEADLSNNLYKLWNRMSSGSYFPPPVRRVDIPKGDSKTETRPLGIPTVADRVAQEVVKRYLEPILEPIFHKDSYGYRPGRSAIDAVRTARQRCWRYDWVLDIDVRGYFDSIDWELLLKAVRIHTDCPWVLLYIERWLKAPAQMEDGSVVSAYGGNAAGWGRKPLPGESVPALRFRHVDGAELSRHPIRKIRGRHHLPLPKRRRGAGIMERPGGPRLRPAGWFCIRRRRSSSTARTRTGVGTYPIQSFDFLGYEFRPRTAVWRGGQLRCLILARGQSEGAEGYTADDPTMGTPSSERQVPG